MSTEQQLAELDAALRRLSVPGPVPARIRVAIRRRRHLRLWLIFTCLAVVAWPPLAAFAALYVAAFQQMPEGDRDDYPGFLRGPTDFLIDVMQNPATPFVVVVVLSCVYFVAFAGLSELAASRHGVPWKKGFSRLLHPDVDRVSWRMGWLRIARRYALVMEIARAIVACAEAHRAGGERLAPELRKVSRRLAVVTRGLGAAHRHCSSVPLLSHRRRVLRAHERQVIAALQACESRLDSHPRSALEELGGLLQTIAERYCQVRVGALLDEPQLKGALAGPDREWLRVIIWAMVTAGGVVGVSFAGLSDGAEPVIMALVAIFVAAVVWNRNVRRALDIVGLALGP